MGKRSAVLAVGALLALPGMAFGAASENASCMGQAASQEDAPPGSKGAFVSQVAKNSERGFSGVARPAAQCEDRG